MARPPGMGSGSDIYATISNWAASGAGNLGELSTFFLNAGLGVESLRQALTTVANYSGTDQQQLAAINAELMYLNSGAYARAENKNTWLFVIGGGLLLYLALRDRNS